MTDDIVNLMNEIDLLLSQEKAAGSPQSRAEYETALARRDALRTACTAARRQFSEVAAQFQAIPPAYTQWLGAQ